MTAGPFGDQKLNGPGATVGVSRRILRCEAEIEPLYLFLVKAATEVGWSVPRLRLPSPASRISRSSAGSPNVAGDAMIEH